MSDKFIALNHRGDGDWVMARVGGVYNEKTDHVIAMHRDGRIVGGVVYTGFLGGSIFMHSAGVEDNWCTRDFLWMIFDYPFHQLGLNVLYGTVPDTNLRALSIDQRLGWRILQVLYGAGPGGTDVFLLEYRREDFEQSKWAKIAPRHYRSPSWEDA